MKKHVKDIIIIVLACICIGLLVRMNVMGEELEHQEARYDWVDRLCNEYHEKADARLEDFHWACDERNKYKKLYESELEKNDILENDRDITSELVNYLSDLSINFVEYVYAECGPDTVEQLINETVNNTIK